MMKAVEDVDSPLVRGDGTDDVLIVGDAAGDATVNTAGGNADGVDAHAAAPWTARRWTIVAGAVITVATLIVLWALQPRLIVANNTPTGGDMGAHVYAPAYLRDHLLPSLRLTGWSNDWYAGFPIYRFYMVVPAILVVLVDIVLPYGVALKIVAVSGLLAFPACAYAFGRLARLASPIPELLVVAALVFLFDESFTIYGGNIASTMAGEFSFSISLSLTLLGFGLFIRAVEEGTHRALAAIVLALAALSHGIVLMFAFGGVVTYLALRPGAQRWRNGLFVVGVAVLLSSFWVVPFLGNHAFMTDMKYEPRPSGADDSFISMFFPLHPLLNAAVMVLALLGWAAGVMRGSRVVAWLGVVGAILGVGVFVARDSLPVIGLLWNPRILPFLYLVRYFLAAVGVHALVVALARYVTIERLTQRAVRTGSDQYVPTLTGSRTGLDFGIVAVTLVVVVIGLGLRFQELPFGNLRTNEAGESKYRWGPISVDSADDGFVDGWARWNFSGYEGKSAYGEYRALVETMRRIGADPAHGCGRAIWENNGELNKYGTTMSLMLLPHWTDGCIGSMEGLFFEASGTTPYHFLTAAAMSQRSSNPVRELRYVDNDASVGVRHMRDLGVRYFMGFTPQAIEQASSRPELREIARSGPWVVFELSGATIVEALDHRPVVARVGAADPRERWLEVAASWFQNPGEWSVMPAADGPAEWSRIDVRVDEARRVGAPGESGRRVDVVFPAEPVQRVTTRVAVVSDVVIGRDSLSFTVDEPGTPVVVRTSYFPNWKAKGADGPWRIAPNMMVVVPNEREVTMSYGSALIDWFAYALTLVGVAVLVVARRRRVV